MNHVMRALIIILCVQVVHAAEPKNETGQEGGA